MASWKDSDEFKRIFELAAAYDAGDRTPENLAEIERLAGIIDVMKKRDEAGVSGRLGVAAKRGLGGTIESGAAAALTPGYQALTALDLLLYPAEKATEYGLKGIGSLLQMPSDDGWLSGLGKSIEDYGEYAGDLYSDRRKANQDAALSARREVTDAIKSGITPGLQTPEHLRGTWGDIAGEVVGSTLGPMVSGIATGGIASALGAPANIANAASIASAVGSGSQQGLDEQDRLIQEAVANGEIISDEQISDARAAGALIGMSQALPLVRGPSAAATRVGKFAQGAAKEGLQELSDYAGQEGVRATYADPRSFEDYAGGALTSTLAGAVVGGGINMAFPGGPLEVPSFTTKPSLEQYEYYATPAPPPSPQPPPPPSIPPDASLFELAMSGAEPAPVQSAAPLPEGASSWELALNPPPAAQPTWDDLFLGPLMQPVGQPSPWEQLIDSEAEQRYLAALGKARKERVGRVEDTRRDVIEDIRQRRAAEEDARLEGIAALTRPTPEDIMRLETEGGVRPVRPPPPKAPGSAAAKQAGREADLKVDALIDRFRRPPPQPRVSVPRSVPVLPAPVAMIKDIMSPPPPSPPPPAPPPRQRSRSNTKASPARAAESIDVVPSAAPTPKPQVNPIPKNIVTGVARLMDKSGLIKTVGSTALPQNEGVMASNKRINPKDFIVSDDVFAQSVEANTPDGVVAAKKQIEELGIGSITKAGISIDPKNRGNINTGEGGFIQRNRIEAKDVGNLKNTDVSFEVIPYAVQHDFFQDVPEEVRKYTVLAAAKSNVDRKPSMYDKVDKKFNSIKEAREYMKSVGLEEDTNNNNPYDTIPAKHARIIIDGPPASAAVALVKRVPGKRPYVMRVVPESQLEVVAREAEQLSAIKGVAARTGDPRDIEALDNAVKMLTYENNNKPKPDDDPEPPKTPAPPKPPRPSGGSPPPAPTPAQLTPVKGASGPDRLMRGPPGSAASVPAQEHKGGKPAFLSITGPAKLLDGNPVVNGRRISQPPGVQAVGANAYDGSDVSLRLHLSENLLTGLIERVMKLFNPNAGGLANPRSAESQAQLLVSYLVSDRSPVSYMIGHVEGAGRRVAGYADALVNMTLAPGQIRAAETDFLRKFSDFFSAAEKAGVNQTDMEYYIASKNALYERNPKVRKLSNGLVDSGSGMTDQEAVDWISDMEKKHGKKTMETLLDKWLVFGEINRQTMIKGGLVAPDAFVDTSPYYVPLMAREIDGSIQVSPFNELIMETEPLSDQEIEYMQRSKSQFLSKSGYKMSEKEWVAPKGRTTPISPGDIYANMYWLYTRSLNRASKNAVGNVIYNMVEQHGDALIEVASVINPEAIPSALQDHQVFKTKFGGKIHTLHIKSAALQKLLTSKNYTDPYRLMTTTKALGFASTVAKFVKSHTIQRNPNYVAANASKDMVQTLLLLRQFKEDFKDIDINKEYINKLSELAMPLLSYSYGGKVSPEFQALYNEINSLGALTHGFMYGERSEIGTRAKQASQPQAPLEKIKSLIKEYGDGKNDFKKMASLMADIYNTAFEISVEPASDFSENLNRFITYKMLTDRGVSKITAAAAAKNITVDFDKGGYWSKNLNDAYFFYTASVNGTMGLINTFAKSGEVRKSMGAVMATGFAAAMASLLAGGEDEEGNNRYEMLPDFKRETSIIFPAGDLFITVPIQYGINIPAYWGSQAARIAYHIMRGDMSPGELAAYSAERVIESVAMAERTIAPPPLALPQNAALESGPLGAAIVTVTPDLLDVFSELAINMDWTGNKIYPEGDINNLVRHDSYWGNTPQQYVGLARFMANPGDPLRPITGDSFADAVNSIGFDMSPSTYEYLVEWLFGGFGSFVSQASNTLEAATDVSKELELYDIPIFNRLITEPSTKANFTEYYNRLAEVKKINERFEGMLETGNTDKAYSFMERNKDKIYKYEVIKSHDNRRRELKKQINALRKLENKTKEQKELLRALEEQHNIMVRRGINYLSDTP